MCDDTAKASSSVSEHVFGDAPLAAIIVAAYRLNAIRPRLHQLVSTFVAGGSTSRRDTPDAATAACLQLACGHSPLLLVLLVLSAVHSYCTPNALQLHTPTVLLLHSYCAATASLLHSYCTHDFCCIGGCSCCPAVLSLMLLTVLLDSFSGLLVNNNSVGVLVLDLLPQRLQLLSLPIYRQYC